MKIVNILEEEDWVREPALRPEDEMMLRKLQDMLQSTAADLKALSDELTNNREQTKLNILVPLDEEFNNKIHIEEIVNAKFHGRKALQKPNNISTAKDKFSTLIKDVIAENFVQRPKVISTAVQVDTVPNKNSESILKKTSSANLTNMKSQNPIKDKEMIVPPASSKPCQAIIYNEVTHDYTDQSTQSPRKMLNIQVMPSINIRSALTEQKVAQLDIQPEIDLEKQHLVNKNSVVIEVSQSARVVAKSDHLIPDNKKPFVNRKTYKMSPCDSSDTSVSIKRQREVNIGKSMSTKTVTQFFKKKSARKDIASHPSHPRPNIEEWRKKLSAVYSTNNNPSNIPTKQNISLTSKSKQTAQIKPKIPFHNIDYIPYSKLTLGGASVAEVEQRLSSRSRKNSNATLNATRPENVKSEGNVYVQTTKGELKILTTSDENLLQAVLDVEKKISKTISKNDKLQPTESNYMDSEEENEVKNGHDNVSYEDDFEDEDKSNPTSDAISNQTGASGDGRKVINIDPGPSYIPPKTLNLSLKDTIDVFEYVHSIDTQDNTTQSNHLSKVAIKEAQTSPQSSSALPIHNNLWPTIDSKGEVEKLFNLEKDFIKKMILEEYGDLLEKNVSKPSTSKLLNDVDENRTRNLAAAQKNTQTSPARVKSSMTSPTRTKSRTTSPFPRPDLVNRDTSPFDITSDDPGISINLSSPRFSLRLPQTSREVLSNIEHYSSNNKSLKDKTFTKEPTHHSSSADMEASSSDLSSLGEVKLKLRRKNVKKYRPSTLSESSSATSTSKCTEEILAGILPLRSEGELSLGILNSEGEVNLHYLL